MSRVAVITGGGSGMGAAAARRFLAMGYDVAVMDLNDQTLQAKKVELEEAGGAVEACGADVSSYESVCEAVQKVLARFHKINVLVNAAGVFRGGLLHESKESDFDLQFNVNVKGMYNTIKAIVPVMLENGEENAIVNIASVSGVNGDYNAPLYCASKAAVIGLTKAVALDYAARGIRVNCISPSATETPMFLNGSTQGVIDAFTAALPDHTLGLPEQIANVAYFLSSEDARHVVGNNICVDGGLSAWNGQPRQDKETAKEKK